MRPALLALIVVLTLGLPVAKPVEAHMMGSFSVNRYSRIEVSPNRVQLHYILDLAEVPTMQALAAVGLTVDQVDERARAWLAERASQSLSAGAQLTIDDQPVLWSVEDATVDLQPGTSGLPTMRVTLQLTALHNFTEGAIVRFHDVNAPGQVGWHEVVLRGLNGVTAPVSSVPAEDQSDELRSFPADPNVPPLDVDSAEATLRLASASPAAAPRASLPGQPGSSRFAVDTTADQLSGYLRNGATGNLSTLLIALGVAAVLGAFHAFGPGHGKTVVGAYLVGSRGTAAHAVLLGLTVTVTHTLGVYLLGLLTMVAAQYVVPEQLYPVLGALSGLMVAVIGLTLARSRLALLLAHRAGATPRKPDHDHALPKADPNPDAGPTHHTHRHGRSEHRHPPDQTALHRHGAGPLHSHLPPGGDGGPVTVRSLLALGVSGGLLPCPSALVVLLAAVSFHNVGFGLALVAAFSVGLAAVLTGIGLATVYAGRWLGQSRLATRLGASPLSRALPTISAVAVTVAGIVMTFQAVRGVL